MMNEIDRIMERASEQLAAMDYPACERLCLEALALARRNGDFDAYARILLPLQEARRQRRQIAVDAGAFILADPRLDPEQIVQRHAQGCLMLLSPPYTPEDEQAIRNLARERGLYVEALLFEPQALRQCFEQQLERVGDAALAAVPADLTLEERLDALARVVKRIGDHEIAHQRLAAAARAAARQKD